MQYKTYISIKCNIRLVFQLILYKLYFNCSNIFTNCVAHVFLSAHLAFSLLIWQFITFVTALQFRLCWSANRNSFSTCSSTIFLLVAKSSAVSASHSWRMRSSSPRFTSGSRKSRRCCFTVSKAFLAWLSLRPQVSPSWAKLRCTFLPVLAQKALWWTMASLRVWKGVSAKYCWMARNSSPSKARSLSLVRIVLEFSGLKAPQVRGLRSQAIWEGSLVIEESCLSVAGKSILMLLAAVQKNLELLDQVGRGAVGKRLHYLEWAINSVTDGGFANYRNSARTQFKLPNIKQFSKQFSQADKTINNIQQQHIYMTNGIQLQQTNNQLYFKDQSQANQAISQISIFQIQQYLNQTRNQ
ncbi:Hypothetical_protein [Hexamita inflata]|uniref:Hypothetical_protein n=1 Tax=Hexamita inflata TaxID=28002 RepID=A0ABP1JIX2_9EUKA